MKQTALIQLSPEELQAKGRTLARLVKEREALEASKKRAATDYGEEIADLSRQINGLASEIDEQEETEPKEGM